VAGTVSCHPDGMENRPQPLPEPDRGTRFADMTGTQKGVFLVKLLLCIVTFGFAFPHVQTS
jgi:hypothetical protein